MQTAFDLIARWQTELGIVVEVDQSFNNWTQRYKGFGADMQPFDDGVPRASWEICPARECVQLFEGKVLEVRAIGLSGDAKRRSGFRQKWDFYLGYKPLEASCSDNELDVFLGQGG